jgi:hypothetical protein
MVTVKQNVIPAFPLGPNTVVHSGAVTALEVYKGNILRMYEDGTITIHHAGGSVVVNAIAGDDYVFTDGIITIDVSVACMIG